MISNIITPQNQPLPPNPYSEEINPEWHNAYSCCLDLENGAEAGNRITKARILGYLVIEAPMEEGRTTVCREILRCGGESGKLGELADLYLSHLICLCELQRHILFLPVHPSPRKSIYLGVFQKNPPWTIIVQRKNYLKRDDFHCLCSGIMETAYYLTLSPALQPLALDYGYTNAAHIFPSSTNQPEHDNHSKTQYAGTVWAIVRNFSGISALDELNGPSIHRLENILTLGLDVRTFFDNLHLWFEAVPNIVNTYDIRSPLRLPPRLVPQTRVTFTTKTELPLPDPRYLKRHAAVCRIAHLSGAAEYIESYDRYMDSHMALAPDGSSADILSFALQKAQVI